MKKSFFVLVRAAETSVATFATANAVGCTFVFAVALKPTAFLEEHLHANGGKRKSYDNDGDEKDWPKHTLIMVTGDG